MSKSIRTIYRNGQIELPPEVQLPDNTYVTVILPDDLAEDAAPIQLLAFPIHPYFSLPGKVSRSQTFERLFHQWVSTVDTAPASLIESWYWELSLFKKW